LSAIGDKGLWVTYLEQMLVSNDIDLAVHSMKDLPSVLAPGLCIGAVPQRELPLDALALPSPGPALDPRLAEPTSVESPDGCERFRKALDALLPFGARVGTSSRRRASQLLRWRPDLQILPVRGNVDTRLRKLDGGDWDALVLAAAGLRRLGLSARISLLFPSVFMTPAAGQGALALEIREADQQMFDALQTIHDGPTAAAVAVERSFVRTVDGGCSVPLGVYASVSSGQIHFRVLAMESPAPDGTPTTPLENSGEETVGCFEEAETIAVPAGPDPFTDLEWAVTMGKVAGERFLIRGGADFVARLKGA
jgi:hydroxymethylbilane synthase